MGGVFCENRFFVLEDAGGKVQREGVYYCEEVGRFVQLFVSYFFLFIIAPLDCGLFKIMGIY
jgi:hypothetical protein